jgi:hypothetical protein
MTRWARRLSAGCWLVVGAVLIRVASGGGLDLGSFQYAAERESPLSYVVGAVVLAASMTLAVGLVFSRSHTLLVLSGVLALPTLLFAAFLVLLDGHPSGLLVGGAALGAGLVAMGALVGRPRA